MLLRGTLVTTVFAGFALDASARSSSTAAHEIGPAAMSISPKASAVLRTASDVRIPVKSKFRIARSPQQGSLLPAFRSHV
ncbi:hypothetical protein IE4872_CH01818 [Rhizobium gallicum]|uniref:Uncharacterized protein n=1 Tax=Rhizobium gallicum TaxID=56730 RepID=A0A1L5NHS8_9HYPH|nr:hypothetical protein IE4872_CH01818 [Rhizobium gallicum]